MNKFPIDSSGIGIVAWGCSGGYTIFCSNDVLEPVGTGPTMKFKTEIAETLKDIRSFISVNRIRVDYYALEFTSLYKVYTIYRSSYDRSTGAFIAVTVYVPHQLKVHNMRAILNEMMDGFYRTYMNTVSGAPLPVSFYDIEKFNLVIRKHEGEITLDSSRFMKRRSVQDDTPRIWVYNDDSELDKFFDMPYYPRFYESQEVMFISREIWDKKDEYEIKFPVSSVVLTDAGVPEGEGRIARFDVDEHKLVKFLINGVEMDVDSGDGYVANSGDILEITISHEYYQPWSSDKISFEEALRKQILYQPGREKLYLWNPNGYTSLMKPAENFLPLNVRGEGISTEFISSQLALYDGRNTIKPVQQSGQWGFVIKGKQWDTYHSLHMCPCKSENRKTLEIQSGISPASFPNGIDIVLQQHQYQIAPGSAKPAVNVTVSFGNKQCSFMLPNDKSAFVAPVGAQVDFKAKGYRCTVKGNELTFVPLAAVPGGEPEGSLPNDYLGNQQDTGAVVGYGSSPAAEPGKSKQSGGSSNTPSHGKKEKPANPEPVKYTVDAVNCSRFILNDRVNRWKRVHSEAGDTQRAEGVTNPMFYLMNSRGETVCFVNLNAPEANAAENRKHGFIVTTQPNTNYCRIEYKQSIFQRLGNKLIYSIGGLMAVLALVGGLYLFLFQKSAEEKKYGQVEALYDKYFQQGMSTSNDTINMIHLIDSCAIYANDKGKPNSQNDNFNDLAFKIVEGLKDDIGNRAAALYLLYMGEASPKRLSVEIPPGYRPIPAFRNTSYVGTVKKFIANNPNNAPKLDEGEGTESSVIEEPNNQPEEAQTTTGDVKEGNVKEGDKPRVEDPKKKAEAEKVQKFLKLYAGLGNMNVITPGEINKVRAAYNKLPATEKKPEYDNKIKAYEALVKANSFSGIQKVVLQDYPNAFSKKQTAALKKVDNDVNYQKTIWSKGYIDIDYISKNIH